MVRRFSFVVENMVAKKKTKAYADIGPYVSLGIQFAATILIFVFLGWWLDDKFATTPLFLVLGTLLGAGGGFYKLYRTLMDLDERRKREDGP